MMLPRADRLEAQHAFRGRRNHRADLGMMIFFVGIRNYDPNDPLLYRDTWIAALICMDSDGRTLPARERESALAQRLAVKKDDAPQIVCIPACMGRHYSSEGIAGKWPNSYVVFANCDRWGANSLVAKNGSTLILDERGDENLIIVHDIG